MVECLFQGGAGMYHGAPHIKVRELLGCSNLLPVCRTWGSNSGHQAWPQHLLSETSNQSQKSVSFTNKFFKCCKIISYSWQKFITLTIINALSGALVNCLNNTDFLLLVFAFGFIFLACRTQGCGPGHP